MTMWLVSLIFVAALFVGILVHGAALWDEWREHRDFVRDGLVDHPAHADACHICAQRRTK